jgi:uncharacterized surface protein with fasciclin (FAS1) repeats
MKKILSLMIFAIILSSPLAAFSAKPDFTAAAKPGEKTIVEIVLADDGEFDILQAAVIKAGLADVLNGKGQYTVFAPTDAAFVKTLGTENKAEALDVINSFNEEALKNILLYHVTEGRRNSRSVLAAPRYRMLNNEHLTKAELLEAGITSTDLSAKNGVIHIINSVLLP